MKRTFATRTMTTLALLALVFVSTRQAAAHCEVPCGVYDDQARFVSMLEDTTTIGKAIAGINDLWPAINDGHGDAKSANQLIRWVTTKDDHATKTQHVIAQYFMTQRIKADDPEYVKKLTAAHAVMVAAMKCKQDAAPATVNVLREAILDFYRAYDGREPQLETQ